MKDDELADTVLVEQESHESTISEVTIDIVMRGVAAAPSMRPASPWIGDRLRDRYRLEAFLGQGGMGSVFRAFDAKLEERIALKVVRGYRDARILRDEVRLAQRVTHPNVCRTFDLEDDHGVQFVKMELVAGETLEARLARKPLSIAECLRIARQIAAGLAAAHARNIAHNDLKPANVMLDGERVVLMDFGIASLADSPVEGVHGTLGYIAPERWHGSGDTRSDLYALGCVLYEMLAGEHLVPSSAAIDQMVELLAIPAPDVRVKRPDTPRWLAHVVNELLAIDPARREHGVARLVRAPRSRARIVAPIAVVLAAAAGAVAWPLTHRPGWTAEVRDYTAYEENIDTMSFSPNGEWIVFGTTRKDGETWRPYIMRRAGSGGDAYELDAPPGDAAMPEFTGDDAIRYLLTKDGKQQSMLQPVGGYPLHAIAAPRAQPLGRPCGEGRVTATFDTGQQRLVYHSPTGDEQLLYPAAPHSVLFVQGCDQSGERVLVLELASYARTGNLLIVNRGGHLLCAGGCDRSGDVEVTYVLSDGKTGAATWGYEDRSLVVARTLDDRSQLWEVFFDGSAPRQLVHDEGPDAAPAVSPDGKFLAFTHDTETFIPALSEGTWKREITKRKVSVFYPRPITNELAVVQVAPAHGTDVELLRLADGKLTWLADGRAPFPSVDGRTIYFIDPTDSHLLSSVPTAGGTAQHVVRLPGELNYGNAGPDGLHVLVTIGDDSFGYRITSAGEAVLESTGLVSVAPDGGWRTVTYLATNHLALVAPGHALTDPAFVIETESVHHPFLDATHFSYCKDGGCYVYDLQDRKDAFVGEIDDLEYNAAVMPDRKSVLFSELHSHATQHLVTNFGER